MKIIGTGCGPGMLTEAAISCIKAASHIVGSQRAIDLVTNHITPGCVVEVIEDYKKLRTLPDHTVVLSTGDPMMSGLGYLGGEIIPGISSVQYGAALLGVPLTSLYVITAHGRDPVPALNETQEILASGKNICIITDPSFSIPSLIPVISDISPEIRLITCENLGYPDEVITEGTLNNPPKPQGGMYILFLIRQKTNKSLHKGY